MHAFELYNERHEPTGIWCCGKCRRLTLSPLWTIGNDSEPKSTREAAELCCTTPKCKTCGSEFDPSHSQRVECGKCEAERRTLERARAVAGRISKADDATGNYDGPLYMEDSGGGDWGEGFFSSMEALLDYLEYHDGDRPQWVFACTPQDCKLDIDDMVEQLTSDGYEDMADNIHIPASLREAVEEFNRVNETALRLWNTDYKRKIRVPSPVAAGIAPPIE